MVTLFKYAYYSTPLNLPCRSVFYKYAKNQLADLESDQDVPNIPF